MLRPATPAEAAIRDLATYEAWGTSLTLEQYQAREKGLRAHRWSQAEMTSWFWTEGEDVLASCETFRMPALWGNAEGFIEGIASVYTEPKHRGHGHATRLMQALASRPVLPWALVLFSDVGETLYARAGFVPRLALDRRFEPEPGAPEAGVDGLVSEQALAAAWAQVRWPSSAFRVTPTADQLDWHLERERLYSGFLGRQRPVSCGARVGAAQVFWFANLRTQELIILWLDAQRQEEAVALLRSARRVAHAAGLSRVTLWEEPMPFGWPEGQDGGTLVPRVDSLPMIRPLTSGLEAGALEHAPRALWM